MDNSTISIETAVNSEEQVVDQTSEPFVGRWQNLVSTTNWEKGKIIHDCAEALIESDAAATEYSDEAWARTVGGVTSPHVGRLRRVYDTFGSEHETYPGLYWSHFLAALEWDDAAMWLEGAMRSGWSVAGMREQRWQSMGGDEDERPDAADIVVADTDEDVILPAQGGSGSNRQEDGEGNVASGPSAEDPDFGEEGQELGAGGATPQFAEADAEPKGELSQPFAGLPELPGDMSEALEMFKLSVLRHKATHWADVPQDVVLRVLDGLRQLTTSEA